MEFRKKEKMRDERIQTAFYVLRGEIKAIIEAIQEKKIDDLDHTKDLLKKALNFSNDFIESNQELNDLIEKTLKEKIYAEKR